MTTNPNYTKRPSCIRRLFGTLTAFIMAAAVVYIAAFLIIFDVLGVPARNESGWLGPQLRYLKTGPYKEGENSSQYLGDTAVYSVFRPLNTLWLRTKTLPEIKLGSEDGAANGGEAAEGGRRGQRGESGQRGGREGRAGRADGGRTRQGGERASSRRTTAAANAETTSTKDIETTGTAEGRRSGRRNADRSTPTANQ